MASDKLYELAFKYKKTKIWKKFWNAEIFAVQFLDGEIGYIHITGMAGYYNSFEVYVGEKAYTTYMNILNSYSVSSLFYQEVMLQQDCLQCTFSNKDNLEEDEREEVIQYARKHGIMLRGRNSYPQFKKYQPGYVPWKLEKEQDEEYLSETLMAIIELAKILETKSLRDIGIKVVNSNTDTIPLIEFKNGKYKISNIDLPKTMPIKYIVPDVFNDINVAKLKNIKQSGTWECELVQYPMPIQNTPDEVPHFPMIFLAVESDTKFIMPIPPVEHFKENPGGLIDIIVDTFLAQNICPKFIKVRDERSYHLLKVLCKKLKTKLKIESELPLLDDVEDTLMHHLEKSEEEKMQDIMNILNKVLELDDESLQSLPDIVTEQLKMIVKNNILPENISQRLEEVFDFTEQEQINHNNTRKTTKGKRQKVVSINQATSYKANHEIHSYVISVSCGIGCYRHIQISENSTLFELHTAILDAFEFDDDHAHAFFMDNKIWSNVDAYFSEGLDDTDRYTCDYKLYQINLSVGKQFKYVFDFGDEWLFQCKVLRMVNGDTEIPLIKRSKGEPPQQYGDWDDWDDWDE